MSPAAVTRSFSQREGPEFSDSPPLISCRFRNPTAVILPTEDADDFKPAPVVASFSARGPGMTESILKVIS